MKLKLVSVFLLFLFSIVVAFPGYSNGAASARVKTSTIKAKKATAISWKTLLKKCLSKGINMMEEERNIEEDEVTESGTFFYPGATGELAGVCLAKEWVSTRQELFHSEKPLNKIFSPPELLTLV